MVCDTEPTAPQLPPCENCTAPAQLQCGRCEDLFFCDKPACFEALHPRARDHETHVCSITSYGTSSKCALHPGEDLCLVCEDPACGKALICLRCTTNTNNHAGHKTTDIVHYMERQRRALRAHMDVLTKQRDAAEEESSALGAMLHRCEAVCKLGDNQVLRVVTDIEVVMRSIASLAEKIGARCLGASLEEQLPKKVPARSVHDAIGEHVCVTAPEMGLCDTVADLRREVASSLEVPEDCFVMFCGSDVIDEGADVGQLSGAVIKVVMTNKYAAIAALRALGETDLTEQRLANVADPKVMCLFLQAEVVTAFPDDFLPGKLFTSLGITDVSVVSRLVDSPDSSEYTPLKVTLDFSGLGCVTSIGKNFFLPNPSHGQLKTMDLSALTSVTSIGDGFLHNCGALTTLNLSGMTSVITIGNDFVRGCKALTTLNLSGMTSVTTIGDGFLYEAMIPTLDLSSLTSVTTIGNHFCNGGSFETLDLSGLTSVTEIGSHFFAHCSKLRTLDLSYLSHVTSIGGNFAASCSQAEIRYRSIASCSSLVVLNYTIPDRGFGGFGGFGAPTVAVKEVVTGGFGGFSGNQAVQKPVAEGFGGFGGTPAGGGFGGFGR